MFFPSETSIPWLEKALDQSYRRHTVLASNVANADTPEYTPRDIDFTEFLEAELNNPGYLGPNPGQPHAEVREGIEPALDGNMVDLEKEMVEMTSNRIYYELASEITSQTLQGLYYAIDEGGR